VIQNAPCKQSSPTPFFDIEAATRNKMFSLKFFLGEIKIKDKIKIEQSPQGNKIFESVQAVH
jgi:hypothetical protein